MLYDKYADEFELLIEEGIDGNMHIVKDIIDDAIHNWRGHISWQPGKRVIYTMREHIKARSMDAYILDRDQWEHSLAAVMIYALIDGYINSGPLYTVKRGRDIVYQTRSSMMLKFWLLSHRGRGWFNLRVQIGNGEYMAACDYLDETAD